MAEIEIDADNCKIRVMTTATEEQLPLTAADWLGIIRGVAHQWKELHAIVCQKTEERLRLEAALTYRPASGSGFTTEKDYDPL